MNAHLERVVKRLKQAPPSDLATGLKGLEKESLRVNTEGSISTAPHPPKLGSALCHPYITTDYSEALVELVTGARSEGADALQELELIHQFMYQNLGDERLWVASMPCVLHGAESIPIARYGSSNVGRMKHVYRVGLGFRYGRIMQAISGLHFNYSPSESTWPALAAALEATDDRAFRDRCFMGMLRNLKTNNWLVSYLFGASPAVCKSFLPNGGAGLEAFDRNTWYYPHGTSLRLSDIGYSNRAVGGLQISYNSLEEYVAGLARAIAAPHPPYARIGTRRNGEWLQLNANVLQIENEYYSFVRPKRIPEGNEKRTSALSQRGIQYVELRSVDLDPWEPLGMSADTMRFLEVFSLAALLAPSEPMTARSQAEQDDNLQTVARCGRRADVMLSRSGHDISLRDWSLSVLDQLDEIAELLDAGNGVFRAAVSAQRAKVEDVALTPSARVLADMRSHSEGFYHFAMRRSAATQEWFANQQLASTDLERMKADVVASHEQQATIEAQDTVPFEDYLADYFSSD